MMNWYRQLCSWSGAPEYWSRINRHTRYSTMLAALLASMCATTGFAAEDLLTPDGFSDFRSPGAVIVDRPMDIVKDKLTAFPESIEEGRPRLELKSYLDGEGRLVIDLTETGFLDDSVDGANWVYWFGQNADGKFQLQGYGYRQKCGRGAAAGTWVPSACP